jgi:hypothetical protein
MLQTASVQFGDRFLQRAAGGFAAEAGGGVHGGMIA